jgi:hypothetical protein
MGEMSMVVHKCDLCGQVKECLQKEIDHTEYDICRECWDELGAKLQGKGRVKDTREIILLNATVHSPSHLRFQSHFTAPRANGVGLSFYAACS